MSLSINTRRQGLRSKLITGPDSPKGFSFTRELTVMNLRSLERSSFGKDGRGVWWRKISGFGGESFSLSQPTDAEISGIILSVLSRDGHHLVQLRPGSELAERIRLAMKPDLLHWNLSKIWLWNLNMMPSPLGTCHDSKTFHAFFNAMTSAEHLGFAPEWNVPVLYTHQPTLRVRWDDLLLQDVAFRSRMWHEQFTEQSCKGRLSLLQGPCNTVADYLRDFFMTRDTFMDALEAAFLFGATRKARANHCCAHLIPPLDLRLDKCTLAGGMKMEMEGDAICAHFRLSDGGMADFLFGRC